MSENYEADYRRYVEEVWNNGNLAVIDEYCAPNYVTHDPAGSTRGREEEKQQVTMLRNGVPDLHATIDDLFATGDKVVCRWTARGTHTGEFMGIPPTNKPVEISGTSITRIENGKIVEDWTLWDSLGMMQQLGVVPPMGPPQE